MTPTEHEGTVAVDAAARKLYEQAMSGLPDELRQPFEEQHPLRQNAFREQVLPLVWAALEALPDRRREAWAEGWRAAATPVDFEGEKAWAHTVTPEGYEGNPYGG